MPTTTHPWGKGRRVLVSAGIAAIAVGTAARSAFVWRSTLRAERGSGQTSLSCEPGATLGHIDLELTGRYGFSVVLRQQTRLMVKLSSRGGAMAFAVALGTPRMRAHMALSRRYAPGLAERRGPSRCVRGPRTCDRVVDRLVGLRCLRRSPCRESDPKRRIVIGLKTSSALIQRTDKDAPPESAMLISRADEPASGAAEPSEAAAT